jgi:hypothetical protein
MAWQEGRTEQARRQAFRADKAVRQTRKSRHSGRA